MIQIIGSTPSNQISGGILTRQLEGIENFDGIFYRGFPIVGGTDGNIKLDGLLCSPKLGVLIFHYVDGRIIDDNLIDKIDEVHLKIKSKLSEMKELSIDRELVVPIYSITFSASITDHETINRHQNIGLTNNIINHLENLLPWNHSELYTTVLSRLQSMTNLKPKKRRKYVTKSDSKGFSLKSLENKLATLDIDQTHAVLEEVNGVQRIRGLAGSGKTIVLARKIAHIHANNPDWNIAVTFHTRSLKDQFKRLIETFYRDSSEDEIDWDKLSIIHAWGSPSSPGIYYKACLENNVKYHDFSSARSITNHGEDSFHAVCKAFLNEAQFKKPVYDLILIDEAQDFSPAFLKLCYSILNDPKRLIYAYDELQNLGNSSMPSPDEIWGVDDDGNSVVNFDSDSQDITLGICYRNPGQTLTAAHALGFGIYRDPMIQMFDYEGLWNEIGYTILEGELSEGKKVKLSRTDRSSPALLESNNSTDELIKFIKFESKQSQAEWVASEIIKNISEDELLPSDILVIHPEAATMRGEVGLIREILFNHNINSSIAGVTGSPDHFFSDDSITFTSIYRAKGNEAAMVYVINAETCNYQDSLAKRRNILFTAMTRTKAWLRVCGTNNYFDGLIQEYESVKNNNFTLEFSYPTQKERETMRVVNRDMTNSEKNKVKAAQRSAQNLAALLNTEVNIHDIPEDLRKALIEKLLGN